MEAPRVIPSALTMEDVSWNNSFLSLGGQTNNSSIFQDLHPCDEENVFFNCTLKEFLLYRLGPQQIALFFAIPITVVYVLIFVTGVVGNVSVCIVIVRHPSMHTATNYYLFSLAISDLTLLIFGLPNDISIYWHQYPYSLGIVFCKMRALLSEASSYVSVLTIVAFSMERYLAICHPLHLYTMSGLQRPVRIIAAIWVISLVFAMPFFQHTRINYLNYPPSSSNISLDSAFCAMLSKPTDWPVWEMSSIVFFILPAAVILVLYCRMGLRIRARSRNHLGKGVKGSVHGETRQAQSRKAIIRMLAAVVVAFFVCWAPFHAQRLIYIYGQNWTKFKEINEWMFSITGWLYYISSTVNPILYNVMSNRYRVAFRETLCCARKNSQNGIGFSREQSSFRETTIAASGEGSHLVRVRSVSSEPLHRSNTTTRLSRHSTLSSTLSKDYNLNHNSIQKTRWNENNQQMSKKWNNNDSNAMLRRKSQKTSFKGIFSNFTSQDGAVKDTPGSKRNEIKFEVETNNLINSNREDYEMDKIKRYSNTLQVENANINTRLPDSRSDSLIMLSSKKPNLYFNNDSLVEKIDNSKIEGCSKSSISDTISQKKDSVQDVVLLGKAPSNGIRKFYSNNSHTSNSNNSHISFGYPNNIPSQDESFIDDLCDEKSKLKETDDTSETCI